jgi:uncharacterized membrane protein
VNLKQRYLFIDLLRFVAAFFMIQGHVFDALLSSDVKSHPLYYLHDFFHGFVAPAFLFASGVAYGVSTVKRWEDHVVWGSKTRRRLTRFLSLIGIGYALHLPYFSLRKSINEASASEIQAFLQSDVLQCVGVTLLLLQIAVFLIKNKKAFQWAVVAAAAAIIFSAPLTWSAHVAGRLPAPLVSYISPETGSWFPLFPWSAYLLCGVLFGVVFARAQDDRHAASLMLRNAALNVAVLLLAWGVMYLPLSLYPAHDFWKSNPSMFFVRLSVVNIVASIIFLIERWWKTVPRVASIMGRESLFIYIVHLIIVYGSVANRGLSQLVGPTLPLIATIGVVALIFAVMMAITVFWFNLKSNHSAVATWLSAFAGTAFLYEFVRRPW